MKQFVSILVLALAALSMNNSAHAALIFVGYWDVADPSAPIWSDTPPDGPLAYTGQEAAALLFGGNASDYSISTVDDSVANINNMAWYDIIGYGGALFAEDYSNKYLGQFYGPTNDFTIGDVGGSASAFVRDNLTQGVERNYAFKDDGISVPEPSALALLLLGLACVVAGRRTVRIHH
ncbi:MAG: PEP-CTERM sorting domain-containing protein [Halioglobus sp.]|nr:PEP-CTERM sorting domain-containing protein [Halioglobus sp.]